MILLLSLLLLQAADQPAVKTENVIVYKTPGRYAGWPANHGIWIWGNEIVVGFESVTADNDDAFAGHHAAGRVEVTPGDDGWHHATALQQLDTLPIQGIESFERLAGFREVQATIG